MAVDDGGGIKAIVDPEILDCDICYEPLCPPLFQCQNGHVACSSCSKRLTKCHICCQATRDNRCLKLEKLIEAIKFSCSYAMYGCKATLPYSEKSAHELKCGYAPCFCPLPDCTFESGSTELLLSHFDAHHKESPMCVSYDKIFVLPLKREKPFHILRGQDRDLFLLLNNNNKVANGNSLSITHITSSLGKSEFKYELTAKKGLMYLPSFEGSVINIKKWTGAYPAKVFLFVPQNFCVFGCMILHFRIRREE